MLADRRLIVALDVPDMEKLKKLVDQLDDTVCYYKVGMELFYSVGAQAVTYLRDKGKDVFLDLKLHDIPNTVAQSAHRLTSLGVSMFNVHAAGGLAMMKAAAQATAETAAKLGLKRPNLIAVTVLTSIDSVEWNNLGFNQKNIADQVVHLAQLAQRAGLDGAVASPREASIIRKACGSDFLIVTPGVRPQGSDINDQSRIAAPFDTLKAGASYLVVGRPITAAINPRAAAEQILNEMRGC